MSIFRGSSAACSSLPDLYPILAEYAWRDDIVRAADMIWQNLDPPDLVAIHFRHGNGELAVHKSDDLMRTEMKRMTSIAKAQYLDRGIGSRLLICTDSLAADDYFREMLGDVAVMQTKLYPPEGAGGSTTLRSSLTVWMR